MRWLNHYTCERCGHDWEDEWSCQCDDDCPACGARHMSPHTCDELDGDHPRLKQLTRTVRGFEPTSRMKRWRITSMVLLGDTAEIVDAEGQITIPSGVALWLAERI